MLIQFAIFYLLLTSLAQTPIINEPERLTTSPAEDYMPAISPDGRFMAFVSNRGEAANIWIKSLTKGTGLPTPRRLTFQTSGDKDPVFSPDGKSLAYVSYGSDPEGDIYIINLPKKANYSNYTPDPVRLTDIKSADKEPVFTPDGKSIIYTSMSKVSARENIWSMKVENRVSKKLTTRGGQSPTISSDGERIIFVSRRDSSEGSLYLKEIDSGKITKLTDDEYIDSFPTFVKSSGVVFVRYSDDTNSDGEITIDDKAVLYYLDINNTKKRPRPLTTSETYNLFPTVFKGWVYYASKGKDYVDIFRLPHEGQTPIVGHIKKDTIAAEALEQFYPDRPYLWLLGWRAAYVSNQETDNRQALAYTLWREAKILQEQGALAGAYRVYNQITRLFPNQNVYAGKAKINSALLRNEMLDAPASAIIDSMNIVMDEYHGIGPVVTIAKMEQASAMVLQGKHDRALKILVEIINDKRNGAQIRAEASFRRNEIYSILDDRDKVIATYIEVIISYPEQNKWKERATSSILSLAVVEGNLKNSVTGLTAVIDRYDKVPYLQASAMNRIALLYYQSNESLRALETYRQTVSDWPGQSSMVNQALFNMAIIFTENQEYEKALDIYKKLEQDTNQKRAVYTRARTERIKQSLNKALYEMRGGDPQLAIKTYLSLLDYDPTITQAHRGLIAAYASIGKIERAISRYETLSRNSPNNPVAKYSHGLALTYLNPAPLDKAFRLMEGAVEMDDLNPWFRQTLGWIYEQKERLMPESGFAELAMQEYQYALALLGREANSSNLSDLWLNIGNVSYLLKNCTQVRANYEARVKSGVLFQNRDVESLFYKRYGECDFKLGDDEKAISKFEKALELTQEKDGPRRIELMERIALAHQSLESWKKAFEYFSEALALRDQLEIKDGRAIALRNIANNLYFLSLQRGDGEGGEAQREALSYYLGAYSQTDIKKNAKATNQSGALISVEVETGVGGVRGASRGFTKDEERKLIFHHIGKIYGHLYDYQHAINYFDEKLKLIPDGLPLIDNASLLTEKAITLNQIGYYYFKQGTFDLAADRFLKSLHLCRDLQSRAGLVINAGNLAASVVKIASQLNTATLDSYIQTITNALDSLGGDNTLDSSVLGLAFSNLAGLYHHSLETVMSRIKAADATATPEILRSLYNLAGRNAYLSERYYQQSTLLLAKDKTASSAREVIKALINIAMLNAAKGYSKEAVDIVQEAHIKASSLEMDDLKWLTSFMDYYLTHEKSNEKLIAASELVKATPVGYGFAGDPRFSYAALKTISNDLAEISYSKGDPGAVISSLESGFKSMARFGMSPMIKRAIDSDSSDVVSQAARLFLARESISEELMQNEGGLSGVLANWKVEYLAYVDDVIEDHPYLWYLLSNDPFEAEIISSSLMSNQVAITLWHRDEGIVMAYINSDGSGIKNFKNAKSLIEYFTEEMEYVDGVYLVTDKPFTDPDYDMFSEVVKTVTVPSFGYITFSESSRNLNDYSLLALGFDRPMTFDKDARFIETRQLSADSFKNENYTNALRASGILALANAPHVMKDGTYILPVNSKEQAPRWLSLVDFLKAGPDGSLIVSPKINMDRDYGFEAVLASYIPMMGYSSWAIVDDVFKQLHEFSNNDPKASFISQLTKTKGLSRVIGAFDIEGEERKMYAEETFTEKIQSGIEALTQGDRYEASFYLTQALIYTRAAEVTKYEPLLLNRLAEVEFQLGRYKVALKHQARLTAIYKKANDNEKLADSYLLTGVIQSRQERYDLAVRNFSKSLKIYRELGLTSRIASALSNLGISEEHFRRYDKALDAFNQAADLRASFDNKSATAKEHRRIGRIYHLRLNDYPEARGHYESASAYASKSGDSKLSLAIDIERGALEVDSGLLDRAESILKPALKRASYLGDIKLANLANFHLANVHWFRGEYENALRLINRSLGGAEKLNDLHHVAMARNTLGLIYWTLNDHGRAIDNLQKSVSAAQISGSGLDEAAALNNLGLVHRSLGDLGVALEYFLSAREIDERLKSEWGLAYDARNLSINAMLSGELDKALEQAILAEKITAKINDRLNHAKAQLQLAEVIARRDGWQKAGAMFILAADEARLSGSTEALWRALRGVGKSVAQSGDRPEAVRIYTEAIEVVEGMRSSIRIDKLKTGFLENKQELYEELIILLLDEGKTNEAFTVAERARARGFIDLLGGAKIKLKDKFSTQAYHKLTALRTKLSELETAIVSGSTSKKSKKIKERLAQGLKIELERIRLEHPSLAPFVNVEPVQASSIQQMLDPGVTLLEYMVTRDEIVIFVVTSKKLKAMRVPQSRTELAKTIFTFRNLIQDGAPLKFESKGLYDKLIKPVYSFIKGSKVIGIVPHRELHYLSFATLRDEDGYFIEQLPLFYLPSASVFEFTSKRRINSDKSKMKVLAIGNPDLGDFNTDLPLAELETKSIQWSFPFIDVLVRNKATETNTVKNIENYQILHIASHGEFDPFNPLLSSLRLAKDGDNDGVLTAKEVFGLQLSADVVVMSACQTGLGKVTNGDEIIGLNRAFLFSGAHSLISTLWRVDDLASAVIMKRFYRNFARQDKAEALRGAQLAIKKRNPHPSFWAGFTLVGDFK